MITEIRNDQDLALAHVDKRPRRGRILVLITMVALALLMVFALLAYDNGQSSRSSSVRVLDGATTFDSAESPSVARATLVTTKPSPVLELSRLDFGNRIGTWTLADSATDDKIGSTGSVEYSIESSVDRMCIRTTGEGSGCSFTIDGTTIYGAAQQYQAGFSSNASGLWTSFFVVPAAVSDVRLVGDDLSVCSMQRFLLSKSSDAALWACESKDAVPDELSVRATLADGTIIATTVDTDFLAAG